MINFRNATEEDIPVMSEIRLAAKENALSDPAKITYQMYVDHLDRLGRGWLCEIDGRVAGFACASKPDSSIWALFVRPEYEGRGAGSGLLRLASGWLFDLGHQTVTLSTAPNTRAERFYRAQGWERGAMKDQIEVIYTLRRPGTTPSVVERSTRLREVTNEDLPILFEQQFDRIANEMAAFPARERDAFMTHWTTKILGDESVVKRTILFDGQVAGHIVSFEQEGQRLIGYWLGRSFWGKGIASHALPEFLHQEMTRPLRAHVAKHNRGSIRVLEKCGFTVCEELDGEFVMQLSATGRAR